MNVKRRGQFSCGAWCLHDVFSQIAYWVQGENSNAIVPLSDPQQGTAGTVAQYTWSPAKNTTSLMWNSDCRFLGNLIMRKYQRTPNEKHAIYFQGGEAGVYENVNVIKKKEKQRNCSRLKDIKETQQLNAIWDLGLEKENARKNMIGSNDIPKICINSSEDSTDECIEC